MNKLWFAIGRFWSRDYFKDSDWLEVTWVEYLRGDRTPKNWDPAGAGLSRRHPTFEPLGHYKRADGGHFQFKGLSVGFDRQTLKISAFQLLRL